VKKALTAAAPPLTTADRRAQPPSATVSPSEKMKKGGERRELISLERGRKRKQVGK